MTWDWSLPTRLERYAVEQLDASLARVGALGGVRSCSLDWSIHRTIRGSGDLDVRVERPMVWPQVVVRPWAVVSSRTGVRAVPLMTALCRVPDEDHTPRGVEARVDLQDMTLLLDEWLLWEPITMAAGEAYTDKARWAFDYLGLPPSRWRVTDSPLTSPVDRVWLPGESERVSWLRVLNDLMDWAGFYAVWADPMGVYHCEPYRAIGERPRSWRFADDGRSLRYRTKVGVRHPESLAFNRWDFWSKAIPETDTTPAVEPVLHTLVNTDPAHPYSTANAPLGRQVVDRRTDVEGDVAAQVQRAKAEAMADQRTFSVGARFVPVVEHEVVELVNAAYELDVVASVSGRALQCTPGASLDLTLREVLP